MILTINQTKVETTLDGERTLGDVLNALNDWAQGEQQIVMSVLVDGRACRAADLTRDIAEVSSIDLEVVAKKDEFAAKLNIVQTYFSLVEQALSSANATVLRELHSEYGGVASALDQVLVHQPPLTDVQLSVLSGPWTPTAELLGVVVALRDSLTAVRREFEAPEAVFLEALKALEVQIPRLPELSSLWQKGRDHEALELVKGLMNTLGQLQRTSDTASVAPLVSELWTKFRESAEPFLLEIEGALAIHDFVLVGDLIEYELAPRLEALQTALVPHFVLDRT